MSSPKREPLKALAAVGAIVMMALTGCASGPAEAESSSTSQTTSAAPTTAPTITKDHVAETTRNPDVTDLRTVTLVKVLDLNHIEVTPAQSDDTLFGKTFTVAVPGYTSPAAGECGFDEALTFAKGFYVAGDEYTIDYVRFGKALAQIQDGEHVGGLVLSDAQRAIDTENGVVRNAEYQNASAIKNPVREGFALPDHEEFIGLTYDGFLKGAQDNQRGLHKLCPGYGQ